MTFFFGNIDYKFLLFYSIYRLLKNFYIPFKKTKVISKKNLVIAPDPVLVSIVHLDQGLESYTTLSKT